MENLKEYILGRSQWPPPSSAGDFGNFRLSINNNKHKVRTPVGSFAPNSFALFDLGGTVNEWCEDKENGRDANSRVLRGSSWHFIVYERPSNDLLSSARTFAEANNSRDSWGFRCVLTFDSSH